MIKNMSKDFDIIDSRNLLDLINTGKIEVNHTEDLSKTIYIPSVPSTNKHENTNKKAPANNVQQKKVSNKDIVKKG